MKIYNEFITTKWSGGTTTELFIAPKNAQFADRNFHFRLSTATIEVEESTYTPLANIDRHFMVIDGSIALAHDDKKYKHINQFEQDHFNGNCITKSKGKAQAFNLMLMGANSGQLDHKHLSPGDEFLLEKDKAGSHRFLYLLSGYLQIKNTANTDICLLKNEELLELDKGSFITEAKDGSDSNFVLIDIYTE